MHLAVLGILLFFGSRLDAAAIQQLVTYHDSVNHYQTSTVTLTDSRVFTGSNGFTGSASAQAGPGALKSFATGSITHPTTTFTYFGATTVSEGYVTFTCGSCGTASTATSVNLNLDGSLSYSTTSIDPLHETFAGVATRVRIDGVTDHSERVIGRLYDSASGIFTLGAPGQTSVTIPFATFITPTTFTVPLNVPVHVVLQLDAWGQVYSGGGVTSTVTSDFQNTLTFARTGPVFNLPPGLTANSIDFAIVDNRLAAVPEPSAGVLAGIGMVALGVLRRVRGSGRL